MIKRSVVAALLVGHTNPRLTITDYFHPDDEAGHFLKDYMRVAESQLTLKVFIARWMPQLLGDRLSSPSER